MTEDCAARCWRRRACCSAGRADVLEPVETPSGESLWSGPVIGEVVAPQRRHRPFGDHEGGHAVAAHAFGVGIHLATIVGQPLVRSEASSNITNHVVFLLAGDVAQLWRSKIIHRRTDEDLRFYVQAMRNLEFGGCDNCRAMLGFHRELGLSAPDEEYFARYREVEAKTIAFIRRPDIWRAVASVSDALMEFGTISGEKVHEIINTSVEFGAYS